ncbi:lamin tail domain-containing protein [archaeon]|nr:lamin tail domain-containing protein [archaeon]
MKKYFLLFLLLIPFSVSKIFISEIMFNPKNGSEWIEIYTDEIINFSGYKIKDNYYEDEIICCQINCSLIFHPNTYIIIGEQESKEQFLDLCVDDKTIGNSLGNSGDIIQIIKDNETIINYSYNVSTLKGYSLAKINGTYFQTLPTPKNENTYSEPKPMISFYLKTNQTITKKEDFLFVIKNEFGDVNTTFFYNITLQQNNSNLVQLQNQEEVFFKKSKQVLKYGLDIPGQYLVCGKILNLQKCYELEVLDSSKIPCDVSLSIKTQKQIYKKGEKIEYYIELSNNSYDYEIEYYIEDIFFQKIKNKRITKNTNKKSFTPKISFLEKAFLINAKIKEIFCNNSQNNISDTVLVVAKGQKENQNFEEFQTEINVEVEYKKQITPGEIIYPKLEIKKGSSAKYLIEVFVQGKKRVSDIFKIYIYGNNKEVETKIPIKINEEYFQNQELFLIINGLGINKKIPIGRLSEQNKTKNEKLKHDIIFFRKNISNESFVLVELVNNEQTQKEFEVWSYLYSGSKVYSGERENNKQKIKLNESTKQIIFLENIVQELPGKNLKLKVKILDLENNKTLEITKPLFFQIDQKNISNNYSQNLNELLPKITGRTIYKSTNSKLKNYSIYFLVGTIIISIIALIKINKNIIKFI